ncbi:MAG: PocR ligand-binding domain-containing protein, partial [Desulfobacteraceae bacterium]
MQYDIKQIIDLAIFRELLERFTKLTKMATAILDLQGNVILRGRWADICAEFHRVHPETSRRCQESDTILAKKLKSGSKYNIYRCKNGLMDVAVPIVINGVHVGNIFAGQFFIENPDIAFFKKQAGRYGFETGPYLEALSRVPVLSENEVLNTVKFFCQMAIVIGQLGIA